MVAIDVPQCIGTTNRISPPKYQLSPSWNDWILGQLLAHSVLDGAFEHVFLELSACYARKPDHSGDHYVVIFALGHQMHRQ